jgi:hypothetical protein
MVADQRFGKRDHVLGLGVEQADRLDVLLEPRFAQRDHLLGTVHFPEQCARRLVDAGIGRLRRKHHRHEQRKVVDRFELGLGVRIVRGEPREELENVGLVHIPSTCGMV